ncbi:MAG: HAD hydrolase-like protein, partial [Bacteroidaceae bacterium]
MRKYKTLLFDLDGTLTDPMLGITRSVQYALQKFEIQVNDLSELCPFIGPPLDESFKKYYSLSEQQTKEAIAYYRVYF